MWCCAPARLAHARRRGFAQRPDGEDQNGAAPGRLKEKRSIWLDEDETFAASFAHNAQRPDGEDQSGAASRFWDAFEMEGMLAGWGWTLCGKLCA